MEPELSIVSPKPNKTFTKSSYTFRKNYLSKLNIEMINEKEHPNSTKNTSKIPTRESKSNLTNNLNSIVKDDITSSTGPYESFHQGLEHACNKQNKLNFFDDINFFERELTQQEGEEEILSIISDFNDRGSRHESLKNSHTPVSCHSSNIFEDNRESEGDLGSFFRSSLPPSRPKNPFFKNFNDKDKLIADNLEDYLKKGISEDF